MSEDFVSKTPESKALLILEDYEGSNNYILALKHKKQNSKSFTPTRSQAEYIINFHGRTPKVAKKWVKLDSYFGKKMMENKMYTKEPSEIYVEKLLVEKDKSYHIWGKLFENDKLSDIWLPKVAILKEQKKEYFQKNKSHILESIICECGKKYTKCHYKRHGETNRHQEYLKNKDI